MRSQNLIRKDKNMTAGEFAAEERRNRHNFGNRPEWLGLVFTVFVFWLILDVTG